MSNMKYKYFILFILLFFYNGCSPNAVPITGHDYTMNGVLLEHSPQCEKCFKQAQLFIQQFSNKEPVQTQSNVDSIYP